MQSHRGAPADLPALAMSDPKAAERRAQAVLRTPAHSRDLTYALHALGIIERDRGRVGVGLRHFRRGLRIAVSAGYDDRRIELRASLGTALSLAGRRREALEAFDDALAGADDDARARVLVRRGAARILLGDLDGGRADNAEAARVLRDHGDAVWESRAQQNAGAALIGLGRFDEAERHLARAQAMAETSGDTHSAITALHSRGECAHRMGRLPQALQRLYEARHRYEQLDLVPPEMVRDIAVVQLTAGLTEEAATSAEQLVTLLQRDRDSVLRRVDGFIAAATVQLATGAPERAVDLARRAWRASRRGGHVEAAQHARFVMLRAQAATGRVTQRHARAAVALAGELSDRFLAERLEALVLAGRLALHTGLNDLARSAFEAAASHRGRGSALRRATAWYAQAQLAAMRGDRSGMLRACERGLDTLDTHALSLGALELRARATVHGTDLAVLATRQAAADGGARELLRWTERWRATVHALPLPPERRDPALAIELGRLRAESRQLGAMADATAEARRRRIEERIRRLVHTREGDATLRRPRFDVGELLDALGQDLTLANIVGIKGGRFHVTVARRGRVTRMPAGTVEGIDEELEYIRFALRAMALAPDAAAGALRTALEPGLARLETTLLGPAVRVLGDGPLVVVPPATVQAAPWGGLPSLRHRPVTVASSATAWLRARTAPSPRADHGCTDHGHSADHTRTVDHCGTGSGPARTALVAGSDLHTRGAEVDALTRLYPDATVLTGADATVEATLRAIDGAGLAHIGAHGRYRGDSPMFSALDLADGPVTVLDFEQLARPPYRLLLTACESGVGSPTGADELLGLANSLTALGTAGVLASIVPVSDTASVPFSVMLHERLKEGDDLATALLATRAAANGPVATATAWSFLALGAA